MTPVAERPAYLLSEATRETIQIARPAEPIQWVDSVVRSIVELRDLAPGWDGEAAPAIKVRAIRDMLMLLNEIMRPWVVAPSIVPTFDGGLQAEWHRGGLDVEIEIVPGEDAGVLIRDRDTGISWVGDFDEEGRQRLHDAWSRLADPDVLRAPRAFTLA